MPTSSWANAPWNDPNKAVSERRYGRAQVLGVAGGCALAGLLGGVLLGWNVSNNRIPTPAATATATATVQTTITASPKATPVTTFQGIKCAAAGKDVQLSGTAQVHGQAGTVLLQVGGWTTTTSWSAGHPSIGIRASHPGRKGDQCSVSMIGAHWQGSAS